MTPLTQKIDVHHHLIPPAYAQALARSGFQELVGAPLPAWSPESSIETMDMYGMATAILSLSAELRSKYPDRFGSFAVRSKVGKCFRMDKAVTVGA